MQTTTAIDAAVGKPNIFDVDADVPINPNDGLSFQAFHTPGGVPVITKVRPDMIITDAAAGKFQVLLDEEDTLNLEVVNTLGESVGVRALTYEVRMDAGGDGHYQLIALGVMYLIS